jgi:L-ascorbate metabolism protein UlaG (beta-lactamase superfamily)
MITRIFTPLPRIKIVKTTILLFASLIACSMQSVSANQLDSLKSKYGADLGLDGVYLPAPNHTARVNIKSLGVGGYLIDWGDDQIMFAPSYTNPDPLSLLVDTHVSKKTVDRLIPDVSDVDMILVGHAHYDHLLDVPYIMKKYAQKAKLYGSKTMKHLVLSSVSPERIHILNEQASTATSIHETPSTEEKIGSWVYNPSGKIRIMAINSNHAPNATLFRGAILDADGGLIGEEIEFLFEISKGQLDHDLDRMPTSAFLWQEGQSFAYVVDFLDDNNDIAFRLHYEDAASDPTQGFIPSTILAEKEVDVAILTVANFNEIKEPAEHKGNELFLYPQGIINHLNASHYILGHWENFFANNWIYPDVWWMFGLRGKPVLPLDVVPLTNASKFIERVKSASGDYSHSNFTMPKPGANMSFPIK